MIDSFEVSIEPPYWIRSRDKGMNKNIMPLLRHIYTKVEVNPERVLFDTVWQALSKGRACNESAGQECQAQLMSVFWRWWHLRNVKDESVLEDPVELGKVAVEGTEHPGGAICADMTFHTVPRTLQLTQVGTGAWWKMIWTGRQGLDPGESCWGLWTFPPGAGSYPKSKYFLTFFWEACKWSLCPGGQPFLLSSFDSWTMF